MLSFASSDALKPCYASCRLTVLSSAGAHQCPPQPVHRDWLSAHHPVAQVLLPPGQPGCHWQHSGAGAGGGAGVDGGAGACVGAAVVGVGGGAGVGAAVVGAGVGPLGRTVISVQPKNCSTFFA